jgi:hypothetical protein
VLPIVFVFCVVFIALFVFVLWIILYINHY